MKIASGIYKGQSLIVPKSGVKPTTDKVRQAVMNILQGRLRGAEFLDLYCGTGAVGIEALSNGASYACFVESAEKLYRVLKKNLEAVVGDKSLYRTVKHNALLMTTDLMERPLYDIVFADPFYREAVNHYDELYRVATGFLRPGGLFILEHSGKKNFSGFPCVHDRKTYGDTALTLFLKPGGAS